MRSTVNESIFNFSGKVKMYLKTWEYSLQLSSLEMCKHFMILSLVQVSNMFLKNNIQYMSSEMN